MRVRFAGLLIALFIDWYFVCCWGPHLFPKLLFMMRKKRHIGTYNCNIQWSLYSESICFQSRDPWGSLRLEEDTWKWSWNISMGLSTKNDLPWILCDSPVCLWALWPSQWHGELFIDRDIKEMNNKNWLLFLLVLYLKQTILPYVISMFYKRRFIYEGFKLLFHF